PNRRGPFVPLNRTNGVRPMRYNGADVFLLAPGPETVFGCAGADVLAVDPGLNERGGPFDAAPARAGVAPQARAVEGEAGAVEGLTGGDLKAGDLRGDRVLQRWLQSRRLTLPNLKRETILNRLQPGSPLDAVVRQVLEARLTINRITTAKLEAAIAAQDADGR